MTEWVRLAAELIVLGIAVGIIKADGRKLRENIEEQGKDLTAIRIAITDCVTWDDLKREFSERVEPWRKATDQNARDIVAIKAHCQERHK